MKNIRINDLITHLQSIKDEHGNLEVFDEYDEMIETVDLDYYKVRTIYKNTKVVSAKNEYQLHSEDCYDNYETMLGLVI